VGVDCDYVMQGKTEEEIFAKASEHAKNVHHMKEIPESSWRGACSHSQRCLGTVAE